MVARWQASQSSAGPGNRWLGNHRRGGLAVRRFAPGDIVYSYSFANPKGGFYAEYVAVAAEKVGRPPGGLSLREAGASPPKGLTAVQGHETTLPEHDGARVSDSRALGGHCTPPLAVPCKHVG